MNIPSSKVLEKMGELVAKAQATETEEQRNGYVIAIKTLCDLLIQDDDMKEETFSQKELTSSTVFSESDLQRKLSVDDANGTSLLDF
ncbi:DUF5327 family protein [Bacillus sp. AGMB 02131]|uniref:DUF5327 family protein n=1 Tax=Peribacillus faecalis TaxID=2772559 RepID=A0A927H900_9BACI|nr:DUF5327 family protein [Peribacillus faecalis]MBD3107045.1 DUF5327 family protein [Peribacillus faecalis]